MDRVGLYIDSWSVQVHCNWPGGMDRVGLYIDSWSVQVHCNQARWNGQGGVVH